MKRCPTCNRTYTDLSLNFCLEDGSVLSQMAAQQSRPEMPRDPRMTEPQPQMPTQSTVPAGWNVPPQQQYSMQPAKKSSKTWVWVLLILGVLVLLCGGGFVGLLFYVGTQVDNNLSNIGTATNRRTANTSSNRTSNASTTNMASTNSSTSTTGRNALETVDLSPFAKEFNAYGNTEMAGEELMMSSKNKGFYYVVLAQNIYTSEKADTRVTVRNVDNASGRLGYGLVFHSDPKPLQKDYAFLIDSKNRKYRVVYHTPQNESVVTNWTSSNAINAGAAENTLEVRDLDDKIELYINGTMVTSIKNVHGYSGGVPGLYSGDGVKVAFKNLEIRK